jgi:hypothetical protein
LASLASSTMAAPGMRAHAAEPGGMPVSDSA